MSFRQKLMRIRAMPMAELKHRSRERMEAQIERCGWRPRTKVPGDFKKYLSTVVHRFFGGMELGNREWFRSTFPEWVDQSAQAAELLLRHEMELLGFGNIQLPDKIDWHRDPVSGQVWDRRFWTAYDLERDPAGRDSKVVHELNRQQHLPRLGKAFYLTGEERYAAEAISQIESWIEQNPAGFGVNWNSSLEIAMRAESWMWTIVFARESSAWTESSAQRIGEALFAQLQHVYRHMSLYSSPNTHLIGEAAVLYLAGTVFSGERWADAWRERGFAILEQEARKQILSDGVYGELSTYYHCYAAGFYLRALALARRNGTRFAPDVERQVESMLDFLMHIARPDGSIPNLGDDDGGRDLALVATNYRNTADLLGIGAILFSRGDLKFCAHEFAEEAFWIMGEEGVSTFANLEARHPVSTSAWFPKGGYYSHRSGWDRQASHLTFDTGGLGMLTGGHSHADSLSVTLFSRGQDLIVDPGTYLYNGAADLRKYFRSTRAHNTIAIDDCDQADAGGPFRWNSRIECEGDVRNIDGSAYVEASHMGYGRLPQGVKHRRRILQLSEECWVIGDELTGSGEHTYDFWFHFGPDVRCGEWNQDSRSTGFWCSNTGVSLTLAASAQMNAELKQAYVSSRYGKKVPSLSLRARVREAAPMVALTVISAGTSRPHMPAIRQLEVEGNSCAVACAIGHKQSEDIVVLSGSDSDLEVAGIEMKGKFSWVRMANDVPCNIAGHGEFPNSLRTGPKIQRPRPLGGQDDQRSRHHLLLQ
jgi:hypothetical protein